uniref:hypothetical protein n=1 Tax=Bakuella subtropica TaxID=1295181 RepID=UPI0023F2A109|nr:hypothetical protein P4D19_mgp29 [Bakuella subtropica]WDY80872.1 hypothetical protein BKSUB_20 [Bakuella subtropica]
MLWFLLIPPFRFYRQILKKHFSITSLFSLFLKNGSTSSQIPWISFPQIWISEKLYNEEEDQKNWYQKTYFRFMKFYTPISDETLFYFERKLLPTSFQGYVWFIKFKKWFFFLTPVLRTYKLKKHHRLHNKKQIKRFDITFLSTNRLSNCKTSSISQLTYFF